MKLLTFAAACAALATLTAAPAFAASEAVVVKLAQPVPAATKLIAGEAVFVCEADTCVATSPQSLTFTTATCKTIASKFGVVASFSALKPMDDTRLGACNTAARAAGSQMAKQ